MKLNSGTCGIPPWCLFCQSGHCLCFKSLLWFSQLLFPVKTFQSTGKKSENSLLGANIWWYEGAHVVFSLIQSRKAYCIICVCESLWVCAPSSSSMCGCIHYFSYVCIYNGDTVNLFAPPSLLPNLRTIWPCRSPADEYLPKRPRASPCAISVAPGRLPAKLFHPAAGLHWQVSVACSQNPLSKPTTIYPRLGSKRSRSPGSPLTHPDRIVLGNVMIRLPFRLVLSHPSEPSLMRARPV